MSTLKSTSRSAILLLALFSSSELFAGAPPPPPPPPATIPIDVFAAVILVAGVALAAWKGYYENKQQTSTI